MHSDGDVESLVKFRSPSARPTVGVTGAGADGDSVWEQKKLKARKMIAVGAAESPASSARCVGHFKH